MQWFGLIERQLVTLIFLFGEWPARGSVSEALGSYLCVSEALAAAKNGEGTQRPCSIEGNTHGIEPGFDAHP